MASVTSGASIFARILHGVVPSQFILIEDNVANDGHFFLHSVVQNISKRADKVCFVTADCTSSLFLDKYKSSLGERLEVLNIYEDPFGWNDYFESTKGSTSTASTSTTKLRYDIDLYKYLKDNAGPTTDIPTSSTDKSPNSLLVLDSLSLMLLQVDPGVVSRMLSRLIQHGDLNNDEKRRFLCLLNADAHNITTVNTMEYLSNTIVRLDPDDSSGAAVAHKHSTGKITNEKISYQISRSNLEFTALSKVTSDVAPKTSNTDQEAVERLTSSLTFNLSLKEAEKQSRAKLVLPYEKVSQQQQQQQAPSTSAAGGGRILYEPDAADDFDEEDPDDDLDV